MSFKVALENAWSQVLSPLFADVSDTAKIKILDVSAITIDPVYDEPVGTEIYEPLRDILARVNFGVEQEERETGERKDFDAQVTVRTDDLVALGISLDLGDRILFQGDEFRIDEIFKEAQVGARFLLTKMNVVQLREKQ